MFFQLTNSFMNEVNTVIDVPTLDLVLRCGDNSCENLINCSLRSCIRCLAFAGHEVPVCDHLGCSSFAKSITCCNIRCRGFPTSTTCISTVFEILKATDVQPSDVIQNMRVIGKGLTVCASQQNRFTRMHSRFSYSPSSWPHCHTTSSHVLPLVNNPSLMIVY